MKTISSASRRRSDALIQSPILHTAKHCFPARRTNEAPGGHSVKRSVDTSSIQSMVWLNVYNRSEDPTFRPAFSHTSKWCWPTRSYRDHSNQSNSALGFKLQVHRRFNQSGKVATSNTSFQLFPLNKFKYFLTLFSKFFSSFPHGTCSLSVSRQYLALDEIYHPIRTALPSNPTLWTYIESGELSVSDGIVTLSDNLFQGTCTDVTADSMSRDYNSKCKHIDFKLELFPLHSPLLGESLLVSFPPRNNMLKFRG
jgi:hypothetical protein